MKDHLFLLATYTAKPRDPSKTKIAGYMKDPANIAYDEVVSFTVGLKPRDQLESGVVLDLTAKTVVKNKFNTTASFDTVVQYFCEAYPQYMEKAGFTLEKVEDEPTNVQVPEEGTTVPSETKEGS